MIPNLSVSALEKLYNYPTGVSWRLIINWLLTCLWLLNAATIGYFMVVHMNTSHCLCPNCKKKQQKYNQIKSIKTYEYAFVCACSFFVLFVWVAIGIF